MIAIFQDPFIQMALIASLLASFASGTMGSFVVVKRIVFIAGSIAHSILAGTSLCLFLQKAKGVTFLGPLEGAFLAALGSAWLLGWIHLNYKQREDAVIAAIWSTGMAIGVILLSITPGNNVEMMNFLFGNILWITQKDLFWLLGLDFLILGSLLFYYKQFLLLSFDEEQALLRGIKTKRLYIFLLSIIAVTIVLLIQIIGTILVIALLTIPATCAALFTKNLPKMMIVSTILCSLFCIIGLSASYELNWPPGASIALLAALFYLTCLFFKSRTSKFLAFKNKDV